MTRLRVVSAALGDSTLEADFVRISRWAENSGWNCFAYLSFLELLRGIVLLQQSNPRPIETIEVNAHGVPIFCDDITVSSVETVGGSLKQISGFGPDTEIYLSGCNTGLASYGKCIAELLSVATGVRVYGSRGYLCGTRAEGNDFCVASFSMYGTYFPPYPGAVDAQGPACWQFFESAALAQRKGGKVGVKLITEKTITTNLPDDQAENIRQAIAATMQAEPAPAPAMRIGSDARFVVETDKGMLVLELIANGAILRDPIRNVVWQFDEGPKFLAMMLDAPE